MGFTGANAVFSRDQNGIPFVDPDWGILTEDTPTAFAGATANARGNDAGTDDPHTLFTVTGEVSVRVLAICTVDLTGATATLEVGTTTTSGAIIATTTATEIDAGEIWHDASPDNDIEGSSILSEYIIGNGADILETVKTANVTAGNIEYKCFWLPLSSDGNVAAAD